MSKFLKRMQKTMSKKYEMIRKAYQEHHSWTKSMVKNAVVKGWITAEEYKLITGEDYVE